MRNYGTHDLGNGWFANWQEPKTAPGEYATYEVLTIRNPDKGIRIDLEKDSLDRLREIFATV